jgi:hemerythrin-like domain-containing protein
MTDRKPRAIEQLQVDHRNMRQLLEVVRKELEDYRSGQTPDFDLLNSIMDYALNYPDLCHHPNENLIYERMLIRDPTVKSMVGDLLKEHAHLGDLTRKLAAALKNVLRDSEIPREWFYGIVESYLTSNDRHMAAEEETFFPQAILTLHQDDWDEIDASVTAQIDPLFGGKVANDYRDLYERIVRLVV